MIGIDIEEVKKIQELIADTEHAKKLFAIEELDYANARPFPAMHLTGFFCVKESVVKALGGGFIREVVVLHNENGKPYAQLFGKTKELLGDKKIEISISHTKTYATAICQITE